MARSPLHKPEDAFYRNLGQSIRHTRSALGKSQTDVAEHIDVTFQQLQKYEKGVNRIPVQELTKLAAYLEAPLSHFLGEDETRRAPALQLFAEQARGKEFQMFLKHWAAIKDTRTRAAIVELVKAMAAISR